MTPTIIVALIAAFGSIVTAILAAFNRKTVNEIHLSINSRMDQLMKVAVALAKKEGIEEGKNQ